MINVVLLKYFKSLKIAVKWKIIWFPCSFFKETLKSFFQYSELRKLHEGKALNFCLSNMFLHIVNQIEKEVQMLSFYVSYLPLLFLGLHH